jgi:hypothetical protein
MWCLRRIEKISWTDDSYWRTQRAGVWGVQPPRNYSEVLTKLSRIPSSVENTS